MRLDKSARGGSEPKCFQHGCNADAGNRSSKDGLLPGCLDEGLRRQIVDFVGPDLLHGANQGRKVCHVAIDKPNIVDDIEPLKPVIADLGAARPPHQPIDFIVFLEKKLREISPVLSHYSGNQSFGHVDPPLRTTPNNRCAAHLR
jgi:hypothetical protein